MELEEVVDNDFDDYLLSIKRERDLITEKKINILRILWKPSLKKDIKLLEKLFKCSEGELDERDFNNSERDCLINELEEMLEGIIPEKDMDLFIKNCKNVYSYMSVYDKLEKLRNYLEYTKEVVL